MEVEEVPFSELLSEVIDNRGRTCPTIEAGIPLIATNCIRNEILYPTYDKVRFVSKEIYGNWFRGHPKPGDIIFVNKATPGRVCLVPDPVDFCIAQDMVAVRANPKKVYPKFLFALLRSPAVQTQIGNMHVGTLIPHFKKGDFDKLLLPIPGRKLQETIGDTYFELSAKIDLNRRMNATLEAMARALFQSRFVDFDPVRAKLDGRQPAGLDAATAALFPAHFQESTLGHVPQGWEVKSLSEITTLITKGTTPTQDDMASAPDTDAQINYVRVNSIEEDGSIIYDKLTKIPLSVHAGVLKRSVLQANDVLYTIAGTIGRIATAEDWVLPANTNQAVAIIRPKPTIPSSFLVLTMRHEVFREELHNNIVHAVQANLSLGMLSKARAVVPPEDVLLKMFKPISDIMSQISANRAQSRTLATIRDALLPKLLSGELKAEKSDEN